MCMGLVHHRGISTPKKVSINVCGERVRPHAARGRQG